MNEETLTGSCLCGCCRYSITAQPQHFYHCHCVQCRKTTASTFASNIVALPADIEWLDGESKLRRYDAPGRGFTQVFCTVCGSGLPFLDRGEEMLFIPTGTLDNSPRIKPEANIFWSERAPWYEDGVSAPARGDYEAPI